MSFDNSLRNCYQWVGSKSLQNLRKAASRELVGAVYHYFIASRDALNELFEDDMTYQQYFAHEAADEMLHYLEDIRQISRLDSVQRQEFIDHGLGPYLVEDEWPPITFWFGPYNSSDPIDEKTSRWLETIDHVIKAIDFELETINVYETFIKEARDSSVRKVFIEAMNHEKGDLADFNQMLFKLLYTTEPTPPTE